MGHQKQTDEKEEMLDNGEQLWTRIREQDSAALAEVYDRMASVLFSISMKVLNNRWEAEEVVQDTMATLWRKPDSYSPSRGKLSSWLIVLVRNRSIDRYRSRSRRKDNLPIETFVEFIPDAKAKDSLGQAEKVDENEALHKAIHELPGDQQEVLQYAYFKGLSHSEIAEALGISLGTVKSRIRLGMERLRRHLKNLR